MKALGYTFSVKEKILLLLLTLVLMGLGYYYFIYMPTISEINEAGYRIEELTSEGDLLMDQIMALQSKQTELDGMDLENESYLASYNCSKQEMAYLNDILKATQKYNIAFDNVTVDGNLIRRKFSIQFEADDYEVAYYVIEKLYNSKYRCLIDDVSVSASNDIYEIIKFDPFDEDNPNNQKSVSVGLSACFYETMTGGVIDAGIPEEFRQNTVESEASDMVN